MTERISFLTKNELTKTLKRLQRDGDKALDFLMSVIVDEKVDMKLRIDCAKDVLAKRIEVSKEINKDALTRLVAESKINGETRRIRDVSEGDTAPVFMPDQIQKIGGVEYEELDETDTFNMDNVGKV